MATAQPTIVLATDLSDHAVSCVAPVAAIARRLDATLVLLHVVDDPVLAPALARNVAQDAIDARARLEAVARQQQGVRVQVDVRSGEQIVDAILHAAGEHGAAFLAVATQGKTAFQRFRLGSVAEGLVRRSPVPVICFPAAAR